MPGQPGQWGTVWLRRQNIDRHSFASPLSSLDPPFNSSPPSSSLINFAHALARSENAWADSLEEGSGPFGSVWASKAGKAAFIPKIMDRKSLAPRWLRWQSFAKPVHHLKKFFQTRSWRKGTRSREAKPSFFVLNPTKRRASQSETRNTTHYFA